MIYGRAGYLCQAILQENCEMQDFEILNVAIPVKDLAAIFIRTRRLVITARSIYKSAS